MFLRCVFQRILSVLVPLSIIATVYLYLYPIFHGCAFPVVHSDSANSPRTPSLDALLNTIREHAGLQYDPASRAPFRLLVLADPQIEGDSSLPHPDDAFIPRFRRHLRYITSARTGRVGLSRAISQGREIFESDIPRSLRAARKRLDLFGNDYYLAHIYRSLSWWTKPTHVTVLGDLVGSQWVSDAEFETRASRYWNRVFTGGRRVEDDITVTGSEAYDKEKGSILLPLDDSSWVNRIINIAGNHDVGYAGDITEARMMRFGRAFGRPNWDVRFEYRDARTNTTAHDGEPVAPNPSLHLVVLNSLLLDSPALAPDLQVQTYAFMNDVLAHRSHPVEDRTSFTLLLTHLPLHKPASVCTDAPYFSFHDQDDVSPDGQGPRFKAGGLKEQNHLSEPLSHMGILQGLFGMSGDRAAPASGKGRNGLILTGHDHTGCDVVHFVDGREDAPEGQSSEDSAGWSWNARRYSSSSPVPSPKETGSSRASIREVTLRSMMGEFGGNAGLLSVWFDSDPAVREWKYEITMCPLGVQHIWWAVHIIAIVTLAMTCVWALSLVQSRGTRTPATAPPRVRSTKKHADKTGMLKVANGGTKAARARSADRRGKRKVPKGK